jgi:hypothetical protein
MYSSGGWSHLMRWTGSSWQWQWGMQPVLKALRMVFAIKKPWVNLMKYDF